MLGMKIKINAIYITIDIPNCMTPQEIQAAAKDNHLQQLGVHIIRDWQESRSGSTTKIVLDIQI